MSANGKKYVLLTAAYNEERYIGQTIESIAQQTLLPERWVIVSDASTDRTDAIVEGYAEKYPFIRFVRITEKHARNFGAQVMAITRGFEELRGVDYDFIANLDADLTFDPAYYSRLLQKFEDDPRLGLAGGFIYEKGPDGAFRSRVLNTEDSVGHAVQTLRRECYEAIGGWVPMPYGGQDWQALISAQMLGWRIKGFRDLPVYHHRPTGSADHRIRNVFREGRMDYSVGSDPLFEILKVAGRVRCKPYGFGSLVRLCGFLWGYAIREERPVSPEFIRFLRTDQRNMLRKRLHLKQVEQAVPKVPERREPSPSSSEIAEEKPTVHHGA